MDDLIARYKAEIARQRETRGDILDYGQPDPLLVEGLAAITALKAKVEALENRPVVAWMVGHQSDGWEFARTPLTEADKKYGWTETPLVAKEA